MHNRLRPFLRHSLVCLLCFTALVAETGESLVLCVGEDGHIEIEVARDGNCGECYFEENHVSELTAADDHCGTCVDVVLTTSGPREMSPERLRLGKATPLVLQTYWPPTPSWLRAFEPAFQPVQQNTVNAVLRLKSIRLII